MDIEIFIGNLDDPDFDYGQGDWSGNCPSRISPFFPKPHNAFSYLIDLIGSGRIEGRQTDWGTWVAPLYPSEIVKLMEGLYEGDDLRYIVEIANQLIADQKYALVACEIG
ncbi:hypothetical protein [Siminovitchia fortis]|uniref:hypothetical protein n=1 Tax=Siminovitchia fortis TaxID=254758 RepID=UPI00119FD5C0|nr:hypothetical protein [Siminovitchia fortis]